MKETLAVLLLLLAGSAGCATQATRWQSRPYVTRVGSAGSADEPLRAPPGKALVVFVKPSDYESVASGLGQADYSRVLAGRPSVWKPNRVDTIIDEAGHYLGDILPMSHFGAVLDPGHHLFTRVTIPDPIAGRSVRVLEADLAPDKAYFVEVGSGEAYDLLPITPSTASWPRRESWLAHTTRLSADVAAGEAQLRGFADYTAWSAARAKESLERLSTEARARHQLQPGDGL